MKSIQSYLAAVLFVLTSIGASAQFTLQQPINLSAELTTSSRYYNHTAAAFSEISLSPDGFYAIADGSAVGTGYEVFPNETTFSLGALTVDVANLTGVGAEVATVTGLTLDVGSSVDTSDGPYGTSLSGLSGSLTLVDGVPTALSLNANVTLTYLPPGPKAGLFFSGQIAIFNNQMALDVDSTVPVPGLGNFREQWDLDGAVTLPVPASPAGAIQVNFTGSLSPSTFSGPGSINPYLPGNALSAYIAANPGQVGVDILRVDGQFYLANWDGSDGTFTSGVTPGARFFLHSPLLERIEADTWRIEGPSDHGTQTGSGDPVSQRKKILLPKESTFGRASLRIENGVPVELTYFLDFATPGIPGFENTALSGIEFKAIGLSSGGVNFGTGQSYQLGVDDGNVPYGFNSALAVGAHPSGVAGGTVMNTTRALLRNEINNNTDEGTPAGPRPNISADGRQDGAIRSSASTPVANHYLADPFANESGTLTVYNTSGLTVSVQAEEAAAPAAGALQVNFTGSLTPQTFQGPGSISPYQSGNALSGFIAANPGQVGIDVLRVDGQFYLAGWDGSDGTFISGVTPGARFFLHSPLLERIEADTWRAEGASDNGTVTGSGDPISQRKKFLLPKANTFGTAVLRVVGGVPVELNYYLDFSAAGVPGFENTALANIQFEAIGLTSSGASFGTGQTYTIGVDDGNVPYGFNSALESGAHPSGVVSGTVMNTTRGILRSEIGSNTDEMGGSTANISNDGRINGATAGSVSTPDQVGYLADPFASESGTLTVFNASGLTVGVRASETGPPSGALQVNFTGGLTPQTFDGPGNFSPYNPGNALSAFIAANPGAAGADVLRVDGQFYLAGWDGSDGVFISGVTPGARFFLHSPLLERIEADTWRAEGASENGTVTGLGDPISQRKKFLLPKANTFGRATLRVENGVPVELTYELDFTAPGVPGFDGTSLAGIPFRTLRLSSTGVSFGSAMTYGIGVDDGNVSYGFNSALNVGSFPAGVAGGTVMNTTRGILRNEIYNNVDEATPAGSTPNISNDGRIDGGTAGSVSTPDQVGYLADPFASESGTLTVYNAQSDLTVGLRVGDDAPPPAAGAIQVNFTASLTPQTFDGPGSINPYQSGNALSAFIAGAPGNAGADVLRADGQFYLANWDGSDGTFVSGVTPGARFFLHSPLLERIEAQTWRAEGPSSHGTVTGDGTTALAQRKKFLLPKANTFGTATLRIENGVPVELSYFLDFSASGVPGFEGTALAGIRFETITLSSAGSSFGTPTTYTLGQNDGSVPYGFNSALDLGAFPSGFGGGTVMNTTRDILRNEINNNTDESGGNTPNISNDGRIDGAAAASVSSPDQAGYLADPFAGETGTLTVYNTGGFVVGIQADVNPAPTAGALQVNFNGSLTPQTFVGPGSINPYHPGNALSGFIAANPGAPGQDVLRVDGQFYLANWNGQDGTFITGVTPGARFFMHSPLLERIEAQTWRAEGPSSHGTVTGDGTTALAQRKKFLLPKPDTFGTATLRVAGGVPVELTYELDFSKAGVPGFAGTSLANIDFKKIQVKSDNVNFGSATTHTIGVDDGAVPYGFNSTLDLGAFPTGFGGGTVMDTTRAILRNEINNNTDEVGGSTANISNDGRHNGAAQPSVNSPDQIGYLADPFANESGTLTVYTTTGLIVGIEADEIPPPVTTSSLQVNFTGSLTPATFDGPGSISPYQSGNALSAFIAANPGTIGEDVLKVDGQFHMTGWDGSDGVFISGITPGVRFFLHSPLMERIEAQTWRVEGPSEHGTQTGSGDPVSERKKFLLPTPNLFGRATLKVQGGVPVELTYELDFSQTGIPGFENTALAAVNFERITIGSAGANFGTAQNFTVGTDDGTVPYGFNTALALGAHPSGVVGGTVMNTTRGILRNEINNNTDDATPAGTTPNVSSDGRLNGVPFGSSGTPDGRVYLADPFAGQSGALAVYTATGLTVGVKASAARPANAGALQVNFTGGLTPQTFDGPGEFNPYNSGNALSGFIASSGETDVLRVDGQFYLANWDGSDGVFISGVTPGARFFLHSPFLERLEADTWRIEGASENGTQTGSGDPVSQRKKILLPKADTFGRAVLRIQGGVPVELTYHLDLTDPAVPNFNNTALNNIPFRTLRLSSTGVNFGAATTYQLGVDDGAVPYGFNSQLAVGAHPPGVVSGTVFNTTRALLRAEIHSNTDESAGTTANISNDGRLNGATAQSVGTPDQVGYLADPFANESGTLSVFNAQSDLTVSLRVGTDQTPAPAGALQVNFTAGLTPQTFDGPGSINPYQTGNALSAFIAGAPGNAGADVLRADGQFYLANWDGSDGTFVSGVTPGARFFLHSPLLERIEAQTWRAEGPSSHGTVTGDGTTALAQRKKFLLPKANTFGTATLRVENGVPVELTYFLDFSATGVPGFEGTALAGIRFETITLNSAGSSFGTPMTYTLGQNDGSVPYGFNSALDLGAFPSGFGGGTVMNTTRDILRNEINNNTDESGGNTPNISNDGRIDGAAAASVSSPDQAGYLADPFAGETGTLTVYNSGGFVVGIKAGIQPPAASGSLQVNFTAGLTPQTFTGPGSISPYVAGNALSGFIAANSGAPGQDVLRVDGQFYLEGWNGQDGTFISGVTPGARFFLHSPLMERIEADTWRAEGPSSHGTVTGDGTTALAQRKKFLLPRANTWGRAVLKVQNGVPVELKYEIDFTAAGVPGFAGTSLANIAFHRLRLDSTGVNFGSAQTFTIGVDDGTVPYGFNSALNLGAFPTGFGGGTVMNTTRDLLRNEINNNTDEIGGSTANISNDGRINGATAASVNTPDQVGYLADPFGNETGTLTVFTAQTDLTAAIEADVINLAPNAGSLQVNFTGSLSPATFRGPGGINPYLPGNAVSAFIAANPGAVGQDLLRVDGQFYLSGWDGSDGTFITGITPGARLLLHSPLIERIEAQTWRVEGPSDHGTVTGSGDPISQRKKFLLPNDSTFGTAVLRVVGGVPVELSYSLDFTAPGVPGFEGTSFANIVFRTLTLSSAGVNFGTAQTFQIGVDDANVPYGLNSALNTGSFPPGVVSGTILNSTRGIISSEINANTDEIGGGTPNISSDGRFNGAAAPSTTTPTVPGYLANPFATESGTLTVFTASGVTVGIGATVPIQVRHPQAATANQFNLAWDGPADGIFRVQKSSTLRAGGWSNVGTDHVGPSTISVQFGQGDGAVFYRVIRVDTP
ncbi:MAG: hypothetical protein CMO80_06700 [Verrucomicrobiales bacterium]|nr:hypothetical protein [Verrucomicrobiales bacterium]